MITNHNYFSSDQCKLLQDLAGFIVRAVRPEKIICYGARTKVSDRWSCFPTSAIPTRTTCYDLLIITDENETIAVHEIIDKIESYQTPHIRITALVHTITAVNNAIKERNLFFSTISMYGVLIYDRGAKSLIRRDDELNTADQICKVRRQWNKWLLQGQQFLKGAEYFLSIGCKDLCVFMLHQAVEHTCIALVGVCIGYRPATHNLKRLLAMTENCSPCMSLIFPMDTRQEIDLFDTLSRGYSDARYNEVYAVNREIVTVLIERVSSFQNETAKMFRNYTQPDGTETFLYQDAEAV